MCEQGRSGWVRQKIGHENAWPVRLYQVPIKRFKVSPCHKSVNLQD